MLTYVSFEIIYIIINDLYGQQDLVIPLSIFAIFEKLYLLNGFGDPHLLFQFFYSSTQNQYLCQVKKQLFKKKLHDLNK